MKTLLVSDWLIQSMKLPNNVEQIVQQISQYHDEFRSILFKFLSKQSALKYLPHHGYQIVIAFILFTLSSWITYYMLAPSLVAASRRRNVAADSHAQAKWGHMIASFLHALIACIWCVYNYYDTTLAQSLNTRVFGYSEEFGEMFAFSAGYFLWDICCCAWHVGHYGKGFLLHAILGFIGTICCLGPFMMYPTSRFIFFEISTLFVDMHWFLEKLGWGKSWLLLINDTFGLLTYLGIRLIAGSFLTYWFLLDLTAAWNKVPLAYSICSIMANLTTHFLNFLWFYKLLRSMFKRSSSKQKTQ